MTAERITDAELDGLLDLVPSPASPSRDLADRIVARCLAVPQENVRPLIASSRVRLARRPFRWTALVAANALAAAAAATSWDGQTFDFHRLVDLPHKVAQTLHLSQPRRAKHKVAHVQGHGSAHLQPVHRVSAVPASLVARPAADPLPREGAGDALTIRAHPQKAQELTQGVGPLAVRAHGAARSAVREHPLHARVKTIAYARHRPEQPFRVKHAPGKTSFSARIARRARTETIHEPEQRAEGPLTPENEAVPLQREPSLQRATENPRPSQIAGGPRWERRFQNRQFLPRKNWQQGFPRRGREMGRRTRFRRRF